MKIWEIGTPNNTGRNRNQFVYSKFCLKKLTLTTKGKMDRKGQNSRQGDDLEEGLGTEVA